MTPAEHIAAAEKLLLLAGEQPAGVRNQWRWTTEQQVALAARARAHVELAIAAARLGISP